ncbi:MAG: MFS transporter, partial [Saprospiraceae bacterium]|nr:MFS transporter [Saprospiraceae bacterium]
MNLKNSEFFSALQNVDFRYFLSVRFLATFAAQMTSTLLAWQVYKITRDPLALGLIGLFEVLPFISMTLFAGHYVDKYSRKLIIVIS